MVSLPRQRVQEVDLKCRFCSQYHYNARNKGTILLPRRVLGQDDPLRLPYTYRCISHHTRERYGRNLPPYVLARLRREARTNAYEAVTLSPYRRFTYLQNDSEESYESGWMD